MYKNIIFLRFKLGTFLVLIAVIYKVMLKIFFLGRFFISATVKTPVHQQLQHDNNPKITVSHII